MTLRYCALHTRSVVEDTTESEKDDPTIVVYIRYIYDRMVSPKESLRINKATYSKYLQEVDYDS